MKKSPEIKLVDADRPQADALAAAAGTVNRGGVVVFPTTCLYGLGADALDPGAIERLFAIKQRPAGKPILVLIHDLAQLRRLTHTIPKQADVLMKRFWPGRLTLVFAARKTMPRGLTAGTGKIGVRLAAHPVAVHLLKAVGRPLTGTSANLSDRPGCAAIAELDQAVAEAVDLILDAGRLEGGQGSTVVDVTVDPPVVLREGSVAAKAIHAALL